MILFVCLLLLTIELTLDHLSARPYEKAIAARWRRTTSSIDMAAVNAVFGAVLLGPLAAEHF